VEQYEEQQLHLLVQVFTCRHSHRHKKWEVEVHTCVVVCGMKAYMQCVDAFAFALFIYCFEMIKETGHYAVSI